MSSKVIATTFDGALCKNEWPRIGTAEEDMIGYLRNEHQHGTKLVLRTCRTGDMLAEALAWCREHGLEFACVDLDAPKATPGMKRYAVYPNEHAYSRVKLAYNNR
jgi:hypothetical protein